MLKLYCKIIGEQYEYVKHYQPASKRKVSLYATCIMIPVILWFINSFLLISNILNGSLLIALTTGIIAASIIFLIERVIIMSNGSRPVFWFRILLGFIVATLGSISFDEVIFKHDIDNQVASYKNSSIENAGNDTENQYLNEINSQKSVVTNKGIIWNESLVDAKKEADGTGGSHQRNVGKIAEFKMKIANKKEADYNIENNKLTTLLSSVAIAKSQAQVKADTDFKESALLLRIKAMFELISQNGYMATIYILFTLLLFCLEFIVVLIKISSKNSIDEDLEKEREKIIRYRISNLLNRISELNEPEQAFKSVQNAKNLMRLNPASTFEN